MLKIPDRRVANHNGGQLQFGPDGLLYFGTGDGGGGTTDGAPRNGSSLLGKLRIDPLRWAAQRTDPALEPVGRRERRDEIFARGLRNPWRGPFHRRRSRRGTSARTASRVTYDTCRASDQTSAGTAFEGNALIEPPRPRMI